MPQPLNALERALVSARANVADRPEFYRLLLESELLIIAESGLPAGEFVAGPAQKIDMFCWKTDGVAVVPVFSCLERLQAFLDRPRPYVGMKGRDALGALAPGTKALLNPKSEISKELAAEEIRGLLDGTLMPPAAQVSVSKEIRLGQPAAFPKALAEAMVKVLERRRAVSAAYVGEIEDPASGEPPHLVFGVELDGPQDFEPLARELDYVFTQLMPKGQIVDLAPMRPGESEGLLGALARTTPFYRRL